MITLNHSASQSQYSRPEDHRCVLSLKRLAPRLDGLWEELGTSPSVREAFHRRLEQHWPELFSLLFELYGNRYDFFYHLEQILFSAARAWNERPEKLQRADDTRINQPDWFQSQQVVGGALYVDLFSNTLGRLIESVDYFSNLGLTYLHLMPLFEPRPGNSDGGYAISDYRSVDPRLGTIDDLCSLADALRDRGISLVLDFVFNHTADTHDWAMRAQSGDLEYKDFYHIFPDRDLPDQYERTLREIFPTVRRGNFSWHDGMQHWVWTTFNSFQWDLNYQNPAVFRSMADEMFFIANTGVDILRLDAVAFIWKQMGTTCENLPQAHKLIQAFNALARIATPSLLFKSEAIVHPDEVIKYVAPSECQISYNPTLMALLWESLATRETRLLERSLSHRHKTPEGTAWVNYLRCHDDIGWTFDDADAAALGINGFDHRRFLNEFYSGQFEGSFARGVPFQENAETGDMRIAGTLASLAGLEKAIEDGDAEATELAFQRIMLLQSISLSIGGIPLLYLGEEWGMLNDYSFAEDPSKSDDTRWVHRPKMDWDLLHELAPGADSTIRGRIFRATQHLIARRKELPALAGQQMELVSTRSPHLLAFTRIFQANRLVVVANFSPELQVLSGNALRTAGMGRFFQDAITGKEHGTIDNLEIGPYQNLWLSRV